MLNHVLINELVSPPRNFTKKDARQCRGFGLTAGSGGLRFFEKSGG